MTSEPEFKKLTNAEFKALERDGEGDVIDLYGKWIEMTPAQHGRLTGDDSSRLFEYQEEMRYMLNALAAEMAGA